MSRTRGLIRGLAYPPQPVAIIVYIITTIATFTRVAKEGFAPRWILFAFIVFVCGWVALSIVRRLVGEPVPVHARNSEED